MEKALRDLRVIDFTWVLAGPFATRMLADYGAEVIKVQSGVTMGQDNNDNINGYFNTWNRNKLGISINLNKPRGIELVKELVQISDVVIENFSPRVMRNWGLDFDTLKRLKPDIIMLSMSGMGQSGPWRNFTAFGPTIQAFSGITQLTTFPDQAPLGLGYSYADHIAGLTASLAILEALEFRHTTGKGQYIDLSEMESMSTLLGPALLDYSVNGRNPTPCGNRSAHRIASPHGVYRCKGDDRWCAIAVFTEEEWGSFCKALGYPSWTEEERFATSSNRWRNIDQLDVLVEEWTKEHYAEEVMSLLQEAGVAAGVVQDASDLSQDAQLKARGFFTYMDHPVSGKISSDGNPIKLSSTPASFQRAAPLLGQDNEYVYLQLLGMDRDDFDLYIAEGVIK